MIHSVEKQAKTVDLAIEEALKELGITAEDSVIEVLDEGEPGCLLGFGRRPAHVRVSYETAESEDDASDAEDFAKTEEDIEEALEELHEADARGEDEDDEDEAEYADDEDEEDEDEEEDDDEDDAQAADQSRQKSRKSRDKAEKPMTEEEKEEAENDILDFLAHILSDLEIHGTMASYFDEEDTLHIDVEGDELGHAIGRGGETLNALQYLCNLAANKGRDRYLRVVLDIGHYREKNIRNLRRKAQRAADRVKQNGKPYRMPPMNAAERRVVHLALADMDGITTNSEGEEPRRRVVITRA